MNPQKTTILFLAADPTDAARLRLGKELRDIQDRLLRAKMRDEFSLVERMSVRPGDITQAIFDTEPSIIHFAGHGTNGGELCFEDESGKIHPITSEALASLFELLAGKVECVVLNACYSEKQATAIAEHIEYVIGMNKEIGDEAAIAFVGGFYKALGAGEPVERAFQFGLVELKLLNIPEDLTPVLVQQKKIIDVPHFSEFIHPHNQHRNEKKYPDYASFDLDLQHEGKEILRIFMNPSYYDSLSPLLNDIFINYLADIVPAYRYGEKWILVKAPYIIAPLEWIRYSGTSVHKLTPSWTHSVSLTHKGIVPGSSWNIVRINGPVDGTLYGIVTDKEGFMGNVADGKEFTSTYNQRFKDVLSLNEYIDSFSIDKIAQLQYEYSFVLVSEKLTDALDGKIFIYR